MSQPKLLINTHKLNLIIKRFALQLIEMHGDFSQSAIIGLQPRGVNLAKKLADFITEIQPENSLKYGELDHTFSAMTLEGARFLCPKNPISTSQLKISISSWSMMFCTLEEAFEPLSTH